MPDGQDYFVRVVIVRNEGEIFFCKEPVCKICIDMEYQNNSEPSHNCKTLFEFAAGWQRNLSSPWALENRPFIPGWDAEFQISFGSLTDSCFEENLKWIRQSSHYLSKFSKQMPKRDHKLKSMNEEEIATGKKISPILAVFAGETWKVTTHKKLLVLVAQFNSSQEGKGLNLPTRHDKTVLRIFIHVKDSFDVTPTR